VQRLPTVAVAVAFDAGAGDAAPSPTRASVTAARSGVEGNMAETSGGVEGVRRATRGLAGAPGRERGRRSYAGATCGDWDWLRFAEFSEERREGTIEHGGERADVVLTRAGRKSGTSNWPRGPTLSGPARPVRHPSAAPPLPLPLAHCRALPSLSLHNSRTREIREAQTAHPWSLTRHPLPGRSRQCMTWYGCTCCAGGADEGLQALAYASTVPLSCHIMCSGDQITAASIVIDKLEHVTIACPCVLFSLLRSRAS
jgi:hypothetical protein